MSYLHVLRRRVSPFQVLSPLRRGIENYEDLEKSGSSSEFWSSRSEVNMEWNEGRRATVNTLSRAFAPHDA